MNPLAPTITWVPFDSLARLTLALLVGLFVGLEREWRGKDAGLRTFGLVGLLGCMGAMIGPACALGSLAAVGLLVVFLNVESMRQHKGTELTTSAAVFVTALSGVLCGFGHKRSSRRRGRCRSRRPGSGRFWPRWQAPE